MKTILQKFIQKFIQNSKEWGYETIWIRDIINKDDISMEVLYDIVENIFQLLKKDGISNNTYIEIVIHTKTKEKFLNSSVFELEKYIIPSYEIEINLNTNNQIIRTFSKMINSDYGLVQSLQDSKNMKTKLFYNKGYIHIFLYPSDNKLYHIDEWLYGKDIDYVIENELHKI